MLPGIGESGTIEDFDIEFHLIDNTETLGTNYKRVYKDGCYFRSGTIWRENKLCLLRVGIEL